MGVIVSACVTLCLLTFGMLTSADCNVCTIFLYLPLHTIYTRHLSFTEVQCTGKVKQ